jgi:uncharacterized damage-inducible protein DinB
MTLAIGTLRRVCTTLLFTAAIGFADDAIFKADFLWHIDDTEKKLTALANAIPAAKYSWRPQDGVMSVSEVFTHFAMSFYNVPSFAGVKIPAGVEPNSLMKNVTDKPKVMEEMKKAFAHLRLAVQTIPTEDFPKKIKLFDKVPTTVQGMYTIILGHMHEHLGQMIAYARTNGVVPPWSEPAPARP